MEEAMNCKPQALLQRESAEYPAIEFDVNPSVKWWMRNVLLF
jgi:hypothetical protein